VLEELVGTGVGVGATVGKGVGTGVMVAVAVGDADGLGVIFTVVQAILYTVKKLTDANKIIFLIFYFPTLYFLMNIL
jgi:hypothetical protein